MRPAAWDRVIDWVVPVSFGRLGLAVRRRGFAPLARLDGQVALVTGATSGIGAAAARQLAELGADIIAVGRDRQRGDAIVEAMRADGARATFVAADVGEADGRAAVVAAAPARLDVLVHCAGALGATPQFSRDGLEVTWAVHVLAPIALSLALAPRLRAAPAPRVIVVTSGGMYLAALDLDAWRGAAPWDGVRAYAACKRAQIEALPGLAARLPGIAIAAMHPGWVDTPAVRDALPRFHRATRHILRSPDEGADTIAFLAGAAPSTIEADAVYLDRRPRPTARLPGTRATPQQRDALWRLLEAQGATGKAR